MRNFFKKLWLEFQWASYFNLLDDMNRPGYVIVCGDNLEYAERISAKMNMIKHKIKSL